MSQTSNKSLTLMERGSSWGLNLAANLALPFLLARGLYSPKWAKTLPDRIGAGHWRGAQKQAESLIWFHGASVGEVNGLVPIAKKLREQIPGVSLLATTTTATGEQEVSKSKAFDFSCILPFDHPKCINAALNTLHPKILVISETEIWPNLLNYLQRRKVPVILVNARISDYSYPRYQKISFLLKPAFRSFTLVMAQSQLDKERFLSLGVSEDRIQVTGSTKYDLELPNISPGTVALEFGLDPTRPCFVAGSVRPGEEEIVISAYRTVRQKIPGLQLVIAPRHAERFSFVAELLKNKNLNFVRRSESLGKQQADVLLLDTIGELRKVYRFATVAFVGGTLVDLGGHNPLEPASCGIPVIVGPYTSNVRDAIQSLNRVEAHLLATDEDSLSQKLLSLLMDPEERARIGESSYQVWKANLGATNHVVNAIGDLLLTIPITASADGVRLAVDSRAQREKNISAA